MFLAGPPARILFTLGNRRSLCAPVLDPWEYTAVQFRITGDGSYGKIKTHVVSDFVVPILLGGIIAGTLDIGAASLINSAKPTRILQVIASGLLGKSAFADNSTVELGLVLQWAMSIIIASIFVVAVQWRPVLKRHWLKAGLAYGVVILRFPCLRAVTTP